MNKEKEEMTNGSNKICDFLEYTGTSEPLGPVDKDAILDTLEKIDCETAQAFAGGLMIVANDQLLFRDVILAHSAPHLAKQLVEDLSEEMLERLQSIVYNIAYYDGQRSIEKFVNAVHDTYEETPESIEKADKLCSLIKSVRLEQLPLLQQRARTFQILANLVTASHSNDVADSYINARLVKFPVKELDNLIEVSLNMISG